MITIVRNSAALFVACHLTACATGGDSGKAEACPPGMAVYCETYLGKPQRCFCATRDQMQDVLQPVQEPY